MGEIEATVDYTPGDVGPGGGSFAPKPAVVRESQQPGLTTETQVLLRSRLRIASSLLLAGLILFFIRNLFLPHPILGLAILHALLIVGMAAAVAVLAGHRPLSLGRLRAIEVAVFGLPAAFLGAAQYQVILLHAQRDDATMALATLKSGIMHVIALMTIYGTFIPNHWQRAARLLVPMALLPSAVMLALRVTHPELRPVALRVASFEQVSDNVLMLGLAATTSILATHIINALRTEAFEARQLGQYRLGERLGAGGMGEVYLAEHQLLKRPCAVKLIRPGSTADPQALARFEREVRATAQLSHWNTVEIYDYGRTEDGTFYYVMEYLPGLSLADLVERHGPLPPGRVIHLVRQACQALREAHAKGLIHRDLKPANIMAAQRGGLHDVTKLLDFGLVKAAVSDAASAQVSQEGRIIGSPLYMSPEQATGGRPDRRSDLYSLGGVAYFLLAGRAPFQGLSAMQAIIAHARDPVTPPSAHRPGLPDDLERVVLRCLAKPPDDRYQDAAALDEALGACRDAGTWTQADAERWWRDARRPSGVVGAGASSEPTEPALS